VLAGLTQRREVIRDPDRLTADDLFAAMD